MFEDANLSIKYNGVLGASPGSTPTLATLDNGSTLDKLSGTITVSGMDNLTPSSSVKYYLYHQTAAGVKTPIHGSATAVVGGNDDFVGDVNSGIMDARLDTNGTQTLNLIDFNAAIATMNSIAVCPGNAAGDGACATVLSPTDRGAGTVTTFGLATAGQSSIAYGGSGFHVISDNATNGFVHDLTTNAATSAQSLLNQTLSIMAAQVRPTKAGASAVVADNISVAMHPGYSDNDTRVSNLIVRGSNIMFAVASDNASHNDAVASEGSALREGDNMSIVVRGVAGQTYGGDNLTFTSVNANGAINLGAAGKDNSSGGPGWSHLTSLSTQPQLSDAGDGVYVIKGAGTAVQPYSFNDNLTVDTLTALTIAVADQFCSTSTGVAGEYAVVASTNAGTAIGMSIDKVMDNGSTVRGSLLGSAFDSVNDNTSTDIAMCALTHLAGTTYIALADVIAGSQDNVTVYKSTDLNSWTKIGGDFLTTGTVASIDVATTGSAADDTGVWVGINDGGNIELLHYEASVSDNGSNAWRSVSGTALMAGAGTAKVTVATDGTSVIGVASVVSEVSSVNFWYNQ